MQRNRIWKDEHGYHASLREKGSRELSYHIFHEKDVFIQDYMPSKERLENCYSYIAIVPGFKQGEGRRRFLCAFIKTSSNANVQSYEITTEKDFNGDDLDLGYIFSYIDLDNKNETKKEVKLMKKGRNELWKDRDKGCYVKLAETEERELVIQHFPASRVFEDSDEEIGPEDSIELMDGRVEIWIGKSCFDLETTSSATKATDNSELILTRRVTKKAKLPKWLIALINSRNKDSDLTVAEPSSTVKVDAEQIDTKENNMSTTTKDTTSTLLTNAFSDFKLGTKIAGSQAASEVVVKAFNKLLGDHQPSFLETPIGQILEPYLACVFIEGIAMTFDSLPKRDQIISVCSLARVGISKDVSMDLLSLVKPILVNISNFELPNMEDGSGEEASSPSSPKKKT